MIHTFKYDDSLAFGPARPLVELRVKSIDGETVSAPLQVLLDSGADATVLPQEVLDRAEVAVVGRARLRWGSGPSQAYAVYLATILLGSHEINGVRVLGDNRTGEAVLGRDVLNQLVVTLNGPAGMVEIPAA